MDEAFPTEIVLTWKADNVADWLTTIGLEKYVSKFKRHMVTGPVLLQLDETLLDDLNVTSSTDREALVKSVARFSGNVEECLKNKNELEALVSSSNEKECDGKATKFPAFPELLPTIGEEDEFDEKKKTQSEDPLKSSITRIPNEDTYDEQIRNQYNEDGRELVKHKIENERTDVNLPNNMASSPSKNLPSPISKDDDEVASRATQIVQVFSEENMCLRKQLEKCCQEIKHLQNVEKDLRNTQIMYKDLKSAFINREHKEKAMRLRLDAEIAQLQNINAELTDELRETQDMIARKAKDEQKNVKDELINKREEEVKQLQKERKISKTSLQNLERILKQKSSEIIYLQRQLESVNCDACGSKLGPKKIEEEKYVKPSDQKVSVASLGDLDQFYESMLKSSSRSTRTLNRSSNSQKQRFPNQTSEMDIPTCVPVLVKLLKEKDAEISSLRKEINQITSQSTKESKEKNRLQISDEVRVVSHVINDDAETFAKYRNAERRYSDLETAIRLLHVQLAEKDAMIKILQCKYGENGLNSCQNPSGIISTPFRSPSFTSQVSSISSYQDSGIVTTSEGRIGETSYEDMRGVLKAEAYPELEFETRDDQCPSMQQVLSHSVSH